MTFNQGVAGSSPAWLIDSKASKETLESFLLYRKLRILTAEVWTNSLTFDIIRYRLLCDRKRRWNEEGMDC